jgi:hybrid cluster-associated redox disulfide protein
MPKMKQKKTNSKDEQPTSLIDPDLLILELTETFPEITDFLIQEYEFHCVGCIMAGFETLREGAQAHGIIGKDFDEMISRLNEVVRQQREPQENNPAI